MVNLGERVRDLTLEKGRKMSEVADAIGVTRRGLYKKLDTNRWYLDEAISLSEFFGMSVSELIRE